MKNKYQDALDYLKGGNLFGELSNDALEDIEELVDKETPKKHIENCEDREYLNHNYCYACGQKLDWSSEDE